VLEKGGRGDCDHTIEDELRIRPLLLRLGPEAIELQFDPLALIFEEVGSDVGLGVDQELLDLPCACQKNGMSPFERKVPGREDGGIDVI